MKTRLMSEDALAYYVGQDVLIREMLLQEQAAEVPNITVIKRLHTHRESIRNALSELGMEALQKAGIRPADLDRVEMRVQAQDNIVMIYCDSFFKAGTE